MLNIEIYECDGDYIVMVLDASCDQILWCCCGYTSYYQVMSDIQYLTTMRYINELDVYVSCVPQTFEQIDKMFVLHKDKQHIRERLRICGKLLSAQETTIDMKGEY